MRKLYHRALKDRFVLIEWVPAHVGIEGNERADGLADGGARQSSQGLSARPTPRSARPSAPNATAAKRARLIQTSLSFARKYSP